MILSLRFIHYKLSKNLIRNYLLLSNLVLEDLEDHLIENDTWIELLLTVLVQIKKVFGNFMHIVMTIELVDLLESLEIYSAASSGFVFRSI